MGAWGEKAFENDSALDWIAELEGAGVDLLRSTLSGVAETDDRDFVDVDDGSAAIAAAEIVAAALGRGGDRLTTAARAWLDQNPNAIVSNDCGLARSAVERVLGPGSELRELWDENGADNPWLADVGSLVRRLDEGSYTAPSGTKQQPRLRAVTRRPVGEREKQVLVTFLNARGLNPTTEQLARIENSTDIEELRRWVSRATSAPSVEALLDD